MDGKKLGFWTPFIVLALAVVILAVSGGSVDAARGGGAGKGKGGKPTACAPAAAQVTASPNPLPVGSESFDFSGTGFCANQVLAVSMPGVCCIWTVTTDAAGAFTFEFPFVARHPGLSYTVAASDQQMTTMLAYTTLTTQ